MLTVADAIKKLEAAGFYVENPNNTTLWVDECHFGPTVGRIDVKDCMYVDEKDVAELLVKALSIKE